MSRNRLEQLRRLVELDHPLVDRPVPLFAVSAHRRAKRHVSVRCRKLPARMRASAQLHRDTVPARQLVSGRSWPLCDSCVPWQVGDQAALYRADRFAQHQTTLADYEAGRLDPLSAYDRLAGEVAALTDDVALADADGERELLEGTLATSGRVLQRIVGRFDPAEVERVAAGYAAATRDHTQARSLLAQLVPDATTGPFEPALHRMHARALEQAAEGWAASLATDPCTRTADERFTAEMRDALGETPTDLAVFAGQPLPAGLPAGASFAAAAAGAWESAVRGIIDALLAALHTERARLLDTSGTFFALAFAPDAQLGQVTSPAQALLARCPDVDRHVRGRDTLVYAVVGPALAALLEREASASTWREAVTVDTDPLPSTAAATAVALLDDRAPCRAGCDGCGRGVCPRQLRAVLVDARALHS